jgi:hypothetical protein
MAPTDRTEDVSLVAHLEQKKAVLMAVPHDTCSIEPSPNTHFGRAKC